ncbi:MAG: PEP-utilizing enzyme, partial [Candidatus Edwardsbacteria bacterium]|nr:PEP-utilizing enzyme [Candidatus Edwardsbacteria bacterium]
YKYSFIIDLVNGRAYWNMSRLYGHPFFGTIIRPMIKYIDHEAARSFEDLARTGEFKPARPRVPLRRLVMEAAVALRTWIGFPWFAGPDAIQRTCDEYWVLADAYDAMDLENRSIPELITEVREFGLVSARCAFPMMMVASKGLWGSLIIERLTRQWPDIHTTELIAGIPGNKTTEGALELYKLSLMPKMLKPLFRRGKFDDLETELRQTTEGRKYLKRLDDFLSLYGHRGLKDLDMSYPCWKEEKTYVFQMIKNYLQFGPDDKTPLQQYEEAKQRRLALTAEIERRLTSTMLSRVFPVKRALFRLGLKLAHDYFPLRENEKYYGLKCYPGSRRIVLEIGRRYHQAGLLNDPQDVFFLTIPEVERIERTENKDINNLQSLIESRRREWKERIDAKPPFIVRSDGQPWSAAVARSDGNVLRGIAASSGTAAGVARIIREPAEAWRFNKGEILVAPYTEPGWAPLFLLARALVMEVGGAVCHGAIVAREYGIPAVVGARGATEAIRDGEEITVDGDAGLVMTARGAENPNGKTG